MIVYNLVKFQLYVIVSHVVGTPLHPLCLLPTPPFPLVATNLFSLSTFLNSSYEWSHTEIVFLCLVNKAILRKRICLSTYLFSF